MAIADHEENRKAWNGIARLHASHPDSGVSILRSGCSTLRSVEKQLLGEVNRQRLLHLMCQFGVDSLSLAREGAIVTGVDISDESIAIARQLASELKIEATFTQADVLALTESVAGEFDLVYAGYGICHWISDMQRWAHQIASVLAVGGRFILIDDHPTRVLQFDPSRSYFQNGAERFSGVADFYDRSHVIADPMVQWQHPMSDVLQAFLNAGLLLESVQEYGFGYYEMQSGWHCAHDRYWYPPSAQPHWPVMWSMVARKK